MFVLDDSYSMRLYSMPKSWNSTSNTEVELKSYVHNSIWYDPRKTYLPWMKADGTRYPVTPIASTWLNRSFARDPGPPDFFPTFFMPISPEIESAKSASVGDYYRYQFGTVNGALQLIRSRWLPVSESSMGVGGVGCPASQMPTTTTWRQCTVVLGFNGRSAEQERANYAVWASYHSTRMKVAKAAAAEAFGQIGETFRIGFDSINGNTVSGSGTLTPLRIPVDNANGLFRGDNKRAWFDKLLEESSVAAAAGHTNGGGTPLRGALKRAGDYYADSDPGGPWGPGTREEQLGCRQNYAILATDGYWNGDSNIRIGDADGTPGPIQSSPAGKSYTYEPVPPYYDNYVETGTSSKPDTLADVAMLYWMRDLRPDLADNVPDSLANPAFWQHMVTFGISIGLKGRLDYRTDLPDITAGVKHWGDPYETSSPDAADQGDGDHIDDLWHATVNSRGAFSVADNTEEFTKSLLESLEAILVRLGSGSSVSVNSTTFSSDSHVYHASFLSGRWSGELAAYAVDPAGAESNPSWRATFPAPTDRRIVTWNLSVTPAQGSTFPTGQQRAALDVSGRTSAPATGYENAAYIAGDQSRERKKGGVLRDRGTILGDIVNSSPVYVAQTKTIFVGANDGMLHAFDSQTGMERFAYVPGAADMTALASLSDPGYSHRFIVDGPIVVSTNAQTPGKNYLVGTLGRGGKGVFALDVTTPASFSTTDVLWELGDDADLGNVLGEPLFATLNGGRKVAIFGNGINSANERAVLYVVDVETGAVQRVSTPWLGGDNGLFAPRGWDNDGNGTVDYIYAGDYRGNVWKFDFTDAQGEGRVAYGGRPLFTAQKDGQQPQPITAGLALGREPTLTGKLWVFVGTGSLISDSDLTSTSVQSVYGLIDDGSEPVELPDLQQRAIATTVTSGGALQRAFEPASSLSSEKRGWYVDLNTPAPGERVATGRLQLRGSVLVFPSVIPSVEVSCEPGGKGFINALDAFTGTGLGSPYFDSNRDGTVNAGDSVNHNGQALPVGSIDLGIGMPTLPSLIEELLIVGGSTGSKGHIRVNQPVGIPRRVSWREVERGWE